ncbi:MAG: hypothetical protein ACLPGW_21010 [Roseiarcus sp.]
MPPADAPVRARKAAPARRGPKILAALVAGASVDAIAEREGLSRKRVETMLRNELRRRWVAPAEDYARLQIVRLEAMSAELAAKAEQGELPAVDRMLKILDRLDRYHGFTKLTPASSSYDEGARERLLTKLNTMAERMIAARKSAA